MTTKAFFSRYIPADWLDDEGVATLVELIDELPEFVRRAPWQACAAGLVTVALANPHAFVPAVAATDLVRQYEPFVDVRSRRDHDDDDVASSYWSRSVASYVRGLERLPPEDASIEIPDPIV